MIDTTTSLRKKVFAYTVRGKILTALEFGVLFVLAGLLFVLPMIEIEALQNTKELVYGLSVLAFLTGASLSLMLKKSLFFYKFFPLNESDICSYKKDQIKRLREEKVEHQTALQRIESQLKKL